MRGTGYAAAEIVLWMVAAGLIGLLIGWVVRGYRRDSRVRDEFAAMAATAGHEHERLHGDLMTARAEVERLGGMVARPELTAALEPLADDPDVGDLHRRLDAANARIVVLETQLREMSESDQGPVVEVEVEPVPMVESEVEPVPVVESASSGAAEPEPPSDPWAPVFPLVEIAARTRGSEPPADDDLTRIHGVGPRLSALLKESGITSFRQVARLTTADIAVITKSLRSFPGRIERDNWMGSAADEHLAEYGKPVD